MLMGDPVPHSRQLEAATALSQKCFDLFLAPVSGFYGTIDEKAPAQPTVRLSDAIVFDAASAG